MKYDDTICEPVFKPGSRDGCGRKAIRRKNTSGCMDELTLALVYVAAACMPAKIIQ